MMEEVGAVVEVEEEVVVEVVEVAEDYLGRTDRKELSIHTQRNNSIVLVVEVVEVEYIQDSH
jgi:hypothetical protein